MNRLWEVEHPYQMTEGCFFSNDCHSEYNSWASFLEEMGGADPNLNFVFRWDWQEGDGWEFPPGACRLVVYYIAQRKAFTASHAMWVTHAQEPEIRAWLAERWEHVRLMWAPFSGAEEAAE